MIKPYFYKQAFSIVGVLCMLELKPDEFLVGSGDGTVSLVRDMTYAKAKRKPSTGGTFATVKEPTDQVLKEVYSNTTIGESFIYNSLLFFPTRFVTPSSPDL